MKRTWKYVGGTQVFVASFVDKACFLTGIKLEKFFVDSFTVHQVNVAHESSNFASFD